LIDVLWLQGEAKVAAFEVEHTTTIYSGLLRMADLVSMQPNLKLDLFIVAPDERREKVFYEINRPAFARLKPPPPENLPIYSLPGIEEGSRADRKQNSLHETGVHLRNCGKLRARLHIIYLRSFQLCCHHPPATRPHPQAREDTGRCHYLGKRLDRDGTRIEREMGYDISRPAHLWFVYANEDSD